MESGPLNPSHNNTYNIFKSPVKIITFETSDYRLQSYVKHQQGKRSAGITAGLKTSNSDKEVHENLTTTVKETIELCKQTEREREIYYCCCC
jgi:hypothetical protein